MRKIKFLALAVSAVLSFGCFTSCDEDGPKDRTENNSSGNSDDDEDSDDEDWYNCPKCKNGDCIICDGDGIYGGEICYKCDGSGICSMCDGEGGWYL